MGADKFFRIGKVHGNLHLNMLSCSMTGISIILLCKEVGRLYKS
jgi:hypothetical protein